MALLTTGARVSPAGDKVKRDGLDPSGSRAAEEGGSRLDRQGRAQPDGGGARPVGRAALPVGKACT